MYNTANKQQTPRQQARLAAQCVKDGKITQAESWSNIVLSDGTDAVACAIALKCLCCIGGTAPDGTIITKQVLTAQANVGCSTAMAALVLYLEECHLLLFRDYATNSIERGRRIVGIITDNRDPYKTYVDFGYKMQGMIKCSDCRDEHGYSCTRTDLQVGAIIEATIENQSSTGVQLSEGIVHKHTTYKDILTIGTEMGKQYEKLRNQDPTLATFIQPIIDRTGPAMKKAKAFYDATQRQKNPPKTTAQIEKEFERKKTEYFVSFAFTVSMTLLLALCLINADTLSGGFWNGGNLYLKIWSVTAAAGYFVYLFSRRAENQKYQVSEKTPISAGQSTHAETANTYRTKANFIIIAVAVILWVISLLVCKLLTDLLAANPTIFSAFCLITIIGTPASRFVAGLFDNPKQKTVRSILDQGLPLGCTVIMGMIAGAITTVLGSYFHPLFERALVVVILIAIWFFTQSRKELITAHRNLCSSNITQHDIHN